MNFKEATSIQNFDNSEVPHNLATNGVQTPESSHLISIVAIATQDFPNSICISAQLQFLTCDLWQWDFCQLPLESGLIGSHFLLQHCGSNVLSCLWIRWLSFSFFFLKKLFLSPFWRDLTNYFISLQQLSIANNIHFILFAKFGWAFVLSILYCHVA